MSRKTLVQKTKTRLGLRSSTSLPEIREEEILIMDSGNASGGSRTTSPTNSGINNIGNASTISNTSATTTLNTTLNPTDILAFVKQLPTFEGTPGNLQKFIVSVEEIIMLIRGTDQTPYGQLILRTLRNKIKGKADETLNMLDTKLEWDSIRENLKRM